MVQVLDSLTITMTSDTITQLSPQLLNLYEDGLYSDLVIECDDRRWCVHRAVVHLSPPSFAASGEIGEDEVRHAHDAIYFPLIIDRREVKTP